MSLSRLLVYLPLLLMLSGCSTLGYYAQSVSGHFDLMFRRHSIDTLLQRDSTPSGLKQKLRQVLEMRRFASAELGLPDNRSYRDFVPLGREAVVWSVVATEVFSVEPRQWCYLVIGCASYRGYFRHDHALAYAAELSGQGLDVAVEPVPAYSTLGWFDDPLPSTVIDWPPARVAGLIFHELAHQQLYLKGDSTFNEAFANTVEQVGVARWLAYRGEPERLRHWQEGQERERTFVRLLLVTRQRLRQVYQSSLEAAAMRVRKAEAFIQLKVDYVALKRQWGGYTGFDHWFGRPLNNARLASVATYEHWVPAFRQLLDQVDGDLVRFYQASSELSRTPPEPRQAELVRLKALWSRH